MMRLLLDTHALLWALGEPGKLTGEAFDALEDERNDVFVSAVSAWEIAIKRALGKLSAPDDLETGIVSQGFSPLHITFHHAEVAGALPRHHADPVRPHARRSSAGGGAHPRQSRRPHAALRGTHPGGLSAGLLRSHRSHGGATVDTRSLDAARRSTRSALRPNAARPSCTRPRSLPPVVDTTRCLMARFAPYPPRVAAAASVASWRSRSRNEIPIRAR